MEGQTWGYLWCQRPVGAAVVIVSVGAPVEPVPLGIRSVSVACGRVGVLRCTPLATAAARAAGEPLGEDFPGAFCVGKEAFPGCGE